MTHRDHEKDKDITRMLKKVSLDIEVLKRGFPSLHQIRRLHVMDRKYIDFTYPVRRYGPREDDDIVFSPYEC